MLADLVADIGHVVDAVLDGVVEERGDDLVFAAVVRADQRRDRHQMRDIRDASPLAFVIAVEAPRRR